MTSGFCDMLSLVYEGQDEHLKKKIIPDNTINTSHGNTIFS